MLGRNGSKSSALSLPLIASLTEDASLLPLSDLSRVPSSNGSRRCTTFDCCLVSAADSLTAFVAASAAPFNSFSVVASFSPSLTSSSSFFFERSQVGDGEKKPSRPIEPYVILLWRFLPVDGSSF